MKTRIAVFVFFAVGLCPSVVFARKSISREEWMIPDHSHSHSPSTLKPKRVRPAPPPWIPAGKFGLELKDGTRIIGVPAKTWAATLKTRFGIVTIPRDAISRVETVEGEVRVHLKNGDRVSGELVSNSMSFETAFGRLSVPASELVRLSTREAIVAAAAAMAKNSPVRLTARPSGPIPLRFIDSPKVSPFRPR